MSWLPWASLVPTLLVLSATLVWWFTEPKTPRINLIAAAAAALFGWAIAPELCRAVSYSAYLLTTDAVAALRLDLVILGHAKMLVTGVAVVWYVRIHCLLVAPAPVRSPPCAARPYPSAVHSPRVSTGSCEEHGKPCGSRCLSSSTSWASTFPTLRMCRWRRSEPMPPPSTGPAPRRTAPCRSF